MKDAAWLFGMFAGFSYVLGLWHGRIMEGRRWADNADQVWRIERRGKLFKVVHDMDLQG